jgi:hypothetical protein
LVVDGASESAARREASEALLFSWAKRSSDSSVAIFFTSFSIIPRCTLEALLKIVLKRQGQRVTIQLNARKSDLLWPNNTVGTELGDTLLDTIRTRHSSGALPNKT